MASLASKVKLTRFLNLICFFGLLFFLSYWHLIAAPLEGGNPWVIWGLHFIPLACFIPNIISGKPRGHAWLCFMLLLYFTQSVLMAAKPGEMVPGLIYVGLTSILFTSAMMYTRWKSRLTKQEAAQ